MPNLSKLLEKELSKRTNTPCVLNECLDYQLDFITDPAKRKAVCGTRRSAKSFMFALYLINQALMVPKSKCVYLTLTNEMAKLIMWSDILEIIFTKYNIKAECSSKYEIVFENGSVIYLRGLDATPHQMNRLRGQKFDIAVIDEVQDFTQDLVAIIDGVLRMTLAQTNATLCLGGTPGSTIGEHYWKTINLKPQVEWKLFHFDWRSNTSIEPKTGLRVCDAIQKDVDERLAINPLVAETLEFQREVLGQWILDETKLVYKYDEYKNTFSNDALINNLLGDRAWITVLGIDFGFEDASALITGAYHRYDPNYYILTSEKHTHWTLTQLADRIKELKKIYHYSYMVADSAASQSIAEISQHHHLPLHPADKTGKEGFIALLNADLITGNIKINKKTNEALITEMQELIWDEKKLMEGKFSEKASKDNHLCDSMLYAWRFSRHYNHKPAPIEIDWNTATNEMTYDLLKRSGLLPKPNAREGSILRKKSDRQVIKEFKQGLR